MNKKYSIVLFALFLVLACGKNSGNSGGTPVTPPVTGPSDIDYWITTGDQSALLQKQTASLKFGTTANQNATIVIDTTKTYQSIDGYGFCLTDGSAYVLMNMLNQANRTALLKELFGNDDNSIAVSYLRVSIGASDLSAQPYSYDDVPYGQTDMTLTNFNVNANQSDVIAVLKEILAISPTIKILGSPWSAPVWMKTINNSVGGSLKPEYYTVYANYLVKYIQAMKANGITIDAITPQNEPLHDGNNPSMYMAATDEANFVKTALGPAFKAAGLTTKIIVWDHNCDNPGYPITILSDKDAYPFIDGSAFHLYNGDVSALSTVHNAFPNKNLYFTEQWTGANETFSGNLKWHTKNVIIGTMRNWSRNALEWNLASDAGYSPHTAGGCDQCKGALTINNNQTVKRNESYYIIAHASKFVTPSSVRVATDNQGTLYNAAFQRPDGKKVLIVENDDASTQTFNIKFNGKWVTTSLAGGAVGTYVF